MKHKVGDVVRITKDIHMHHLCIGSIHTIVQIDPDDSDMPYGVPIPSHPEYEWRLWFGDDECETVDASTINDSSQGQYKNKINEPNQDKIIEMIKLVEKMIIDEKRVWTYQEIAKEVMEYMNFDLPNDIDEIK